MSRRSRIRRRGWQLLEGDSQELLRQLPDNHCDSMVTDPPYGLSGDADVFEMLKAWLTGKRYEHKSKGGFMGHEWDSFVPGPELWKEAYRVLKPGAHVLVFAGTRTMDVMAISLRLAGFQYRDTLMWLHGQGFPKSLNFEGGLGTALKPAYEPILLFRKPCAWTVAKNVLRYGTGALNIDGCRVSVSPDDATAMERCNSPYSRRFATDTNPIGTFKRATPADPLDTSKGRWPANLVLSHADECIIAWRHETRAIPKQAFSFKTGEEGPGYEVVFDGEDIICADHCPVKLLDDQSGILSSKWGRQLHESVDHQRTSYGTYQGGFDATRVERFTGDAGGASRFFYCAKPDRGERDLGCALLPWKAGGELTGRQEGSAGLNNPRAGAGRTSGGRNLHPTVKPINLMSWLVKLVCPPGGTVLDPFAGSGSTGCAALKEGFRFLGMEHNPEYARIARARLGYFAENRGCSK